MCDDFSHCATEGIKLLNFRISHTISLLFVLLRSSVTCDNNVTTFGDIVSARRVSENGAKILVNKLCLATAAAS